MKRKFIAAGLSLAVGAALAFEAAAQAKPDVLVKQRQAAMVMISKYFGPLGAMAQGKAPFNAQVVARNAAYLEALSHMPWDGFQASTTGEKSRALPAVYSDPAKFKAAGDRLQSAVGQLVSASKGGDEAAMKQAIGAVAKTCGGCHDDFRQKQ